MLLPWLLVGTLVLLLSYNRRLSLRGAFFCRTGGLNLALTQVLHHTYANAVGQHVDDGPDAISARGRF